MAQPNVRHFWESFVQHKAAATNPSIDGPAALADFAAKLALDLLARLGKRDITQDLFEYAHLYRNEVLFNATDSLPSGAALPPQPANEPISQTFPLVKAATNDVDRDAAKQSPVDAVSWLYRKKVTKGVLAGRWCPIITIDEDNIRATLNGIQRGSEERIAFARLTIHELCHYLFHFDSMYPANSTNNFEIRYANPDQEKEAWVLCHQLIGEMVGAIAHSRRHAREFDKVWPLP